MEKLTLLSRNHKKIPIEAFDIQVRLLENLFLGEFYIEVYQKNPWTASLVMDLTVNVSAMFENTRNDLGSYILYKSNLLRVSLKNDAVFNTFAEVYFDATRGEPDKLKIIYNSRGDSVTYDAKVTLLPDSEIRISIV
jgi:hypothetical protein